MERMKTLYFRQPFFIGKLQNFNSLNKSYKPLKGQTKESEGEKNLPISQIVSLSFVNIAPYNTSLAY